MYPRLYTIRAFIKIFVKKTFNQEKVIINNKFYEKRNLKNADKVIAVSDFVGRETQKIFDLNFSYLLRFNKAFAID